MPKVSIIMLTYNREALISDAIKSVIAQTFTDFEYIIVDNGSTDNSGIIADAFASEDKRIKVLHIAKSNIGNGRNVGIDASSGDFITFIDDDDILDSTMIEKLYTATLVDSADIAICGSYCEVDGILKKNFVYEGKYVFTPEDAIIHMLERDKTNIGMPTKLFHRHLFNEIRFLPFGVHDDITTTYKLFVFANKVVMFGEPLYTVRRHTNNISGFTGDDKKITPELLEEYFDAYRKRVEFICDKMPSLTSYIRYSEFSFLISMCNKIKKNNLIACKSQFEYACKKVAENLDEFKSSPYFKSFEQGYIDYIFDT